MPFHLPPITRRRFILGSLPAAGLLVAGRFARGEPAAPPADWALLSDPHIAADPARQARNVNMTEHFTAVVNEVVAWSGRGAGVLINGDLAFSAGEMGDYGAFAGLLGPLRRASLPLWLTLGNHDHREHFWSALSGELAAGRRVLGRQVAIVRSPWANWFLLDSLQQTKVTPGLLGDRQLAWLEQSLDANAGLPAIIVVHHNLDRGGDAKALVDTEALWRVLRPRHQVKACVYGHTHEWKVEQDGSGIFLINLPATSYVFAPGPPVGWVQARLRANGIALELRSLDRAHPEHGRRHELTWRR